MYRSPTHGLLTLEEAFDKVKQYIMSDPKSEYHVMIGCDSQQHKDSLVIVSAIIVHRLGSGAIYFTERNQLHKPYISLREKMYTETSKSIEVATIFKDTVLKDEELPVDIAIHLDIGKTGKTSAFIKELVGYVESCGFEACIKDNSRLCDISYQYPIAASSVADRYSK